MTRYLTSEEIKAELLDMLIGFDAFCSNTGLRYSLAGGTLLGAVRHKGFIPWDDDIDLAMPRPDYEKLICLGNDGLLPEGMTLSPFARDFDHPVFVKLLRTDIAVDAHYEDGIGSLWLDILPIDGLPESLKELECCYREVSRLQKRIMFCRADSSQGKTGLKRLLKSFLVPLANAVGLLSRSAVRLESLGKVRTFGETPWVGAITWGLYGAGERYSIDGWSEMDVLEFEGRTFPVIGCWDEYLHGIYGDYMQLPPVEKRVTHEMKAWRISQ